MADALRHAISVPGIVLPWPLGPRELQVMTTKFWGVRGESRIDGRAAGRQIEIPVLVYDDSMPTRQKLSLWLDKDVDQDWKGQTTTLVVNSAAGRPSFPDTTFDGAIILQEPKIDEAGTLGGIAFAVVQFVFRQHV